MCYHISIRVGLKDLEGRFRVRLENPELLQPIYHASAFSFPSLPVVANGDPGLVQFFQWGLIPFWVKDEDTANRMGQRTLNARAETVLEKPSFRHAVRQNRCLVIADGFYEWREFEGKNYPYYIQLADHSVFALAGIWDTWTNQETGETRKTFSVVTTRANPLLAKIHNKRKRMPVILKREDERQWLSADLDESGIVSLLEPYDEHLMTAHTVSRLITTRGANTNVPAAMEEFRYEGLPD